MTDNELLLSISQILDKKLYPFEKRMDTFDEKLDKLETKIDTVEQNLNTRIDSVEQNLNTRIDTVEQNLNTRIDTVEQNLRHCIRLINLNLENNVIPRLNEIESCYISTSERYLKQTDKIIALEADMSVSKSVILEHSNKLAALGA